MTVANITVEDLPADQPDRVMKMVHIAGQLDESNVDEQAKSIYAVLEANPKNLFLIFDLSQLDYINSKGIGYITDWFGKVSAEGGKIVIAGAKENILDILDVVGLTQLIPSFATVEEAKLGISQPPMAS